MFLVIMPDGIGRDLFGGFVKTELYLDGRVLVFLSII